MAKLSRESQQQPGRWARLKASVRSVLENPSIPLSKAAGMFFGGTPTEAGIAINPRSALSIRTVYQCVAMIAADVAMMPCEVMRETSDGGRKADREHPSYYNLRRKACNELMASKLREATTVHALLRGNGYEYVERDSYFNVIERLPLNPISTAPFFLDGVLRYKTTVNGSVRTLNRDNVIHIRGMGNSPYLGISVVEYGATSMGLASATEMFGARFFGSGSTSSGFIQTPNGMSDEEIEGIKKSLKDNNEGLSKSHRFMLLEEGLVFVPSTIPPNQAQFLETRELQDRVIAGWFNVPPSRLGDTKTRNFASIEMDDLRYFTGCISHWTNRHEEEYWDKLLTERQKRSGSHTVRFDYRELIKMDTRTRIALYQAGLAGGWLNRDEVRAMEDRMPIPDGKGKTFLQALNMAPATKLSEPERARRLTMSRKIVVAQRRLLADAARRVIDRVAEQARRAAQGPDKRADCKKFCDWLDRMATKETKWSGEQFVAAERSARAIVGMTETGLGPALIADLADELGRIASSASAADLYGAVDQAMSEREKSGPAKWAARYIKKPAKRINAAA
jgi:HK97 family phage portal protein